MYIVMGYLSVVGQARGKSSHFKSAYIPLWVVHGPFGRICSQKQMVTKKTDAITTDHRNHHTVSHNHNHITVATATATAMTIILDTAIKQKA